MPRSIRSIATRPLFRAMSVAFDDHGVDRTDARRDQEQRPLRRRFRRPVLQQRRQLLAFRVAQRLLQAGEVPVFGADDARFGRDGPDALLQALQLENGECGSPAQEEDVALSYLGKSRN